MKSNKKPKFDINNWKKSKDILKRARYFELKSSSEDKKVLNMLSSVLPKGTIEKSQNNIDNSIPLLSESNTEKQEIKDTSNALCDTMSCVLGKMAKRRENEYKAAKKKYEQKTGFFGIFARKPKKSRLLEALTDGGVWDAEKEEIDMKNISKVNTDNLKKSVMSKELWASLTQEYEVAEKIINEFNMQSQEIKNSFLTKETPDLGDKVYYLDRINEQNLLKEYGLPKENKDIYKNVEVCGVKGVCWPESMLLDKSYQSDLKCLDLMTKLNKNFDSMQKELFIDYNNNNNKHNIDYLINRMYNLSVFVNACRIAQFDNEGQKEEMEKNYPRLFSADESFFGIAREKFTDLILIFAEEVYKRFFFFKQQHKGNEDEIWKDKSFDCLRATLKVGSNEGEDCVVSQSFSDGFPCYPVHLIDTISRTVGNCYNIAYAKFAKKQKDNSNNKNKND